MTRAEAQNRWLSSQVEDEDKFIEVLTCKSTNNIMHTAIYLSNFCIICFGVLTKLKCFVTTCVLNTLAKCST